MTEVSITTGARLHFGPLCVAAPSGGRFGGVGLMIDAPRTVLAVTTSNVDSVEAPQSILPRVAEFLLRARSSIPVGSPPVPCRITVSESIPAHRGLGSGTQLGLAMARAVSTFYDEPTATLETMALRVQRGRRSAIGLHGFDKGGFLVDGGRIDSNELGTLVARVDFPAEWRFVLAAPRQEIGLSGEAELSAFANQPPMPSRLTAELCRIVLMDWLPSVIEADFSRCSESLYQFGHAVGEFFSSAQGGVFSNSRMAQWVSVVRHRGVLGVAQTSWGPTLAALCPNQTFAEQLQQDFATDATWNDCSFEIVAPLNRGANVRVA